MKTRMRAIVFFLFAANILTNCTTTTTVDRVDSTYDAKDASCEITFYKDRTPTDPYKIIGKIESHIKKDFFLGGSVRLEDDAFKELRKKACLLGGDAVVIDDYIESSAMEMTHVHVWATVIKLTK